LKRISLSSHKCSCKFTVGVKNQSRTDCFIIRNIFISMVTSPHISSSRPVLHHALMPCLYLSLSLFSCSFVVYLFLSTVLLQVVFWSPTLRFPSGCHINVIQTLRFPSGCHVNVIQALRFPSGCHVNVIQTLRFPSGCHVNVIQILLLSLRKTWPIHFHFVVY
jgi:hypothetical protein